MARQQRVEPEVEQLWQDFHSRVNVTSEQLRTWLLTQGSGEQAFGSDPDLGLPEPGRRILAILGKRKVDLTGDDIQVMRDTVNEIQDLVETPAAAGMTDEDRRRALLDLGHDPLIEPNTTTVYRRQP